MSCLIALAVISPRVFIEVSHVFTTGIFTQVAWREVKVYICYAKTTGATEGTCLIRTTVTVDLTLNAAIVLTRIGAPTVARVCTRPGQSLVAELTLSTQSNLTCSGGVALAGILAWLPIFNSAFSEVQIAVEVKTRGALAIVAARCPGVTDAITLEA
jgi:hypothetical protein